MTYCVINGPSMAVPTETQMRASAGALLVESHMVLRAAGAANVGSERRMGLIGHSDGLSAVAQWLLQQLPPSASGE